MNGQLKITYDKRDVPGYVRDILTAGSCRLFLPVGFVEEDGTLCGHFRTEGYRKLSSVKALRTEQIFSIALAILHGVWQAEKRYLFSELYEIRPDCIYVDRAYLDARLVFLPAGSRDLTGLTDQLAAGEREGMPVKEPEMAGSGQPLLAEKLAALMEALQKRGSREGVSYIERAAAFLREDWGYKALVHRLEELRREIYLCSVK